MGTFVLAVMLHATWNTLNRINVPDYITALMLTGMSVLILWLVFLQFEQAQKERVDV
jgi:RsiW-degrading membrane proteinase PrsW (M82 family)